MIEDIIVAIGTVLVDTVLLFPFWLIIMKVLGIY
jgi:hypothetical protein